jgi:hypothetical protein
VLLVLGLRAVCRDAHERRMVLNHDTIEDHGDGACRGQRAIGLEPRRVKMMS